MNPNQWEGKKVTNQFMYRREGRETFKVYSRFGVRCYSCMRSYGRGSA